VDYEKLGCVDIFSANESYTLKIILAVKVQQKLIRKRPALASENATNDERAPPVA